MQYLKHTNRRFRLSNYLKAIIILLFIIHNPVLLAQKMSVGFVKYVDISSKSRGSYSNYLANLLSARLSEDPTFSVKFIKQELTLEDIQSRNLAAFTTLSRNNDCMYIVAGTYSVNHLNGELIYNSLIFNSQTKKFTLFETLQSEPGARLVSDTQKASLKIHSNILSDYKVSSGFKDNTDYSKFCGLILGLNIGYTGFLTEWKDNYDNTTVLMPYLGYEFQTSSGKTFLSVKADAIFFDSVDDIYDSDEDHYKNFSLVQAYGSSLDIFYTYGSYFRAGVNAGGGYCIQTNYSESDGGSEEEEINENSSSDNKSGYLKGGLFIEAVPSALKITLGVSFFHSFHDESIDSFIYYIGAGIRF
ncbi:MAG TPA: hypothetical protein P5123_01900 [Spirochaetota bacterium]|nr:hypothetical protein [Spirochaetota bacterium]